MDLQEAFDAGFVAVKTYVDDALEAQRNAMPDLIRAAVAAAVAELPERKDGVDGKDAPAVTDEQIADAVRSYLQANPPAPGKDGRDGVDGSDGKDADPITEDQIASAVRAYVDANPPKDGEPGKDADPEVIRAMIAEAVAVLPTPAPGKDADPEVIRSMVEEAVAALPPARDGQPGKDAEPITPDQIDAAVQRHIQAHPIKNGEPGQDGQDGKDGKDGVGLAGALIDKDGRLVVTLTDGALRELGQVVGRDGQDGEKGDPGRDGLTLTDFDTQLSEDGRTLMLVFESDEVKVTHELQLPVMIYRGGFKEGATYVEGDTVTFGGSLWCCSAETTEKPVEGRDCWRLAARKGRDGKDAKP